MLIFNWLTGQVSRHEPDTLIRIAHTSYECPFWSKIITFPPVLQWSRFWNFFELVIKKAMRRMTEEEQNKNKKKSVIFCITMYL
jgi:hypothetical protein